MMMGDGELQENDDDDIIISEIDFENLLESLPDDLDLDIFGNDFPVLTDPSCIEAPVQETPNSSPIFGSLSIEEVEQMLMKDDNKQVEEEESQELCQKFFSDFLGDVAAIDQSVVQPRVSNEDGSNPESNLSDDSQEKESDGGSEIKKDDDPICKKRKRQMRNRDAALRSRERKKLYVRDLEIKSRYLEGECKRLQQLLHCCVAENHNLHLQLQKNKAFGASMTKQESAVLLLGMAMKYYLPLSILLSFPVFLFHSILSCLIKQNNNTNLHTWMCRVVQNFFYVLCFHPEGEGHCCSVRSRTPFFEYLLIAWIQWIEITYHARFCCVYLNNFGQIIIWSVEPRKCSR